MSHGKVKSNKTSSLNNSQKILQRERFSLRFEVRGQKSENKKNNGSCTNSGLEESFYLQKQFTSCLLWTKFTWLVKILKRLGQKINKSKTKNTIKQKQGCRSCKTHKPLVPMSILRTRITTTEIGYGFLKHFSSQITITFISTCLGEGNKEAKIWLLNFRTKHQE